MSIEEGEYVITHEDGSIDILDSGFITSENIHNMKFTFDMPKDITESLNKKTDQTRDRVSVTTNGRSAYTPGEVTYPNGKESSKKVPLTNCIVQYREGVKRNDSNYARGYVVIGIPEIYLSKITKDALANSGVNLSVKPTVQLVNGYYWLNCTLDKLSVDNTSIIHQDNNGEAKRINRSLFSLLAAMETNMVCTVLFTLSGSATTRIMQESIDLTNGKFTITMKPTEVVLTDITTIEGPTLDDVNHRKNEKLEKSEAVLASRDLANLAMRKLKIQG